MNNISLHLFKFNRRFIRKLIVLCGKQKQNQWKGYLTFFILVPQDGLFRIRCEKYQFTVDGISGFSVFNDFILSFFFFYWTLSQNSFHVNLITLFICVFHVLVMCYYFPIIWGTTFSIKFWWTNILWKLKPWNFLSYISFDN